MNVPRAWRIARFVLHEQNFYAIEEFKTPKKLMNTFVLSRGDSNVKRKVWVERAVVLSGCLLKREGEREALEFARYMEFMPPLDDADKVLRCVRVHWATGGSAEDGHIVGENEENRDAVAAGE